MGAPDSSLLDLIQKVKSWISWGNSGLNSMDSRVETIDNNTCCKCKIFLSKSYHRYRCQSCGNMFCGNCVEGLASLDGATSNLTNQTVFNIKTCKICREQGSLNRSIQRNRVKVHPSDSPRTRQEPSSPPSFNTETLDGDSPHTTTSGDVSFANHLSPLSVLRSRSRSDGDEGINPSNNFFSVPNEYFHDTCDVDSISVSTGHEFNSFTSVNSSPLESPSRIHITSNRVGHYVQQEEAKRCNNDDKEQAVLAKPAKLTSDPEKLSIFRNNVQSQQPPLDFETNGLIWFPPPPADAKDEAEDNFFTYADEDDYDDDNVVSTSDIFGSSFSSGNDFVSLPKEKQSFDQKESLRAAVQGHFRALVLQLMKGQGMVSIEDRSGENWLDVITSVSWQAANYIKPDTSGGGSMDPCEYVKIKCVASGSPSESKLVKGVVCTKNLKHKRMMSQYKNTRLLLLGGALEYQRVPNQLASFETLLQQEKDHLKTIVSRIEAHRPNVLLVEKSVSSYALENLLAKEISLVLNVKRPLLEQIARCTGATITPSTDHISKTRLGHCELFHLDKVSEEHEPANQLNKKPSKTLMFFEGCPRRLGCTVVLHGACREELKKVKSVVQYAVFAAYHLSLETSFLTDEGASLPTMPSNSSHINPEKSTFDDNTISKIPDSELVTDSIAEITVPSIDIGSSDLSLELGLQESFSELGFTNQDDDVAVLDEFRYRKAFYEACDENLALDVMVDRTQDEVEQVPELSSTHKKDDEPETTTDEYYSTKDAQQSILVSYSSHCIVNGTLCERSRLLRVKFYGPSDKPLGRYLRDDLFDQSYVCQSCKESAEAHVTCYTHQNGNLTINVKRLPSIKLPGERDGKIWMWHRCLNCAHTEGVPPATQRVVMSDAAWGLSFGKFLELSFSTHATGNRVASCGHSLQRDCLRFYGFGNMVAFFRYSPVNILTVHLPPSILEFSSCGEETWIRKEADELLTKAEALYTKLSTILEEIKSKSLSCLDEFSDASELHDHVLELYNLLFDEKKYYQDLLKPSSDHDQEISEREREEIDILEINRLRHSLVIATKVWDRRLYLLSSLLKQSSTPKAPNDVLSSNGSTHSDPYCFDHHELEESSDPGLEEHTVSPTCLNIESINETFEETIENTTSLERLPSEASILSDKIDSAWSGVDPNLTNPHSIDRLNSVSSENLSFEQMNRKENPSFRRLQSPSRVYSFDSAQRIQDRIKKGLPPSSFHLSNLRSFHASGDYRYMVRDPVPGVHRTFSQVSPPEAEKLNLSSNAFPSLISSASLLPEGARLMIPQNSTQEIIITVYDNEPTGIISYALSSKEYEDYITDRPSGGSNVRLISKMNSVASDLSSWQSFGSMDSDFTNFGNYYSSEDVLSNTVASSLSSDPMSTSPHLRISFEDDSSKVSGRMKFSVVCYFAKQFDALRRRCCPHEVDFLRSLGRCRRWNAQGGKSNVYFAKSFDERFIIKQVTKTELESFEEFAPEYFKYLMDALVSGSPTCLAKILGIYQVVVKHPKGGKEVKMDLMIMENLFYKRNISKVYDLKGSERSRYVSDKSGPSSKVLLDMNLLETLRTNPMFLGSKSKRILERAVWNDTSFLASIDVMDYSLLVGVDEERNELVMGIIDFMRQYTWDKHLETWVKASGILGGPKNASPTIISPKQYKKRFRKAMTAYFLTVPDQWTS